MASRVQAELDSSIRVCNKNEGYEWDALKHRSPVVPAAPAHENLSTARVLSDLGMHSLSITYSDIAML